MSGSPSLNLRTSKGNNNSTSATPSRHQQEILESPVSNFRDIIEETSSEDWQRRIAAWEELVERIPDGSAYLNESNWFNSPKILTHLTRPVSELLRDARSSVVRRVCLALTELFRKCQTDARYLFKELMNTIITVQGQTVQVIRQAVQTMVLEVIPEVPCKSVMPFWMERLKDKSPAIREACSLYLGTALKYWSTEATYLTDDIWHQVGTAILKTMRDPAPQVRKHAKHIIQYYKASHVRHYKRLLNDATGPVSKDPKLRQWLIQLGNTSNVDELSVASKYTLRSDPSVRQNKPTQFRISTPRKVLRHTNSLDDDDNNNEPDDVPNSIQVSKNSSPRNATVPARRTPPRPPAAVRATSPQAQTYSELATGKSAEEDEEETSPFIRSIQQLKEHAKGRRSRHSAILEERFKDVSPAATTTPEHILIAIQLLRSHKTHVDQVMETLRMEMDILRSFDTTLAETGRPTETELLEYYESVDLCVEQRLAASKAFRQQMEVISRGDHTAASSTSP